MEEDKNNSANGSVGVFQGDIHNSVILQIINNIQAPADLDKAAKELAAHADALRKKKGWTDARLPLGLFAVCFFFIGTIVGGWPLAVLYICGSALVLCGYRLTSTVYRLDAEIQAAQSLLVELYKMRLEKRLALL